MHHTSCASHTIAVAEVNGSLEAYLNILAKGKSSANLLAMVYHGLSTSAGEKGGRTKLHRKRSFTPSLSSLPTKQRITPQDPSSSESPPPIQSNDTPLVTHSTVHHTPLAARGPSTSIPVLATPKSQPLDLKLLTPSIKICAGCCLGYEPRAPPYEICIADPETRQMLIKQPAV